MDDYFRYMYNGKEADERLMNSRYEEGIEDGENKKQIEIAKLMLKDNVPVVDISKYTNLSVEDINNLKD